MANHDLSDSDQEIVVLETRELRSAQKSIVNRGEDRGREVRWNSFLFEAEKLSKIVITQAGIVIVREKTDCLGQKLRRHSWRNSQRMGPKLELLLRSLNIFRMKKQGSIRKYAIYSKIC